MESKAKKRGRPKGEPTETYHVKLATTDAEWAMASPEGLSGTLRRLLSEERLRRDAGPSPTGPNARRLYGEP